MQEQNKWPVTNRELMVAARNGGYAIGAFNVQNLESAHGFLPPKIVKFTMGDAKSVFAFGIPETKFVPIRCGVLDTAHTVTRLVLRRRCF
jgi:fructose/tagatose bisphosphate aldolase